MGISSQGLGMRGIVFTERSRGDWQFEGTFGSEDFSLFSALGYLPRAPARGEAANTQGDKKPG